MAEAGAGADEVAANRDLWTQANSEYGDEHADRAWAAEDITWGIFNVPEQQLGVLGCSATSAAWMWSSSAAGTAVLFRLAGPARSPATGVDITPAQLLGRAALPGPVRHHLPAHRGRRGGCPAAVCQFRPGRLRMRRQLVVRPGPLGYRGCPSAATGRETGVPHHQHPGHRVLPRAGPGPARSRATSPAAPGRPPENSTGRDTVPPWPRRIDQDPARQRLHHRRAARALRPARCSRSSLLRTRECRMGTPVAGRGNMGCPPRLTQRDQANVNPGR